jgi:RNA polymerase sigma-32 factor
MKMGRGKKSVKIKHDRKSGLIKSKGKAMPRKADSDPVRVEFKPPQDMVAEKALEAQVVDPDYEGLKPLVVYEEPGAIDKLQPLQRYLMEARRYPILTREEEIVLAKRANERGDTGAAQRLIISNLRLVVKIAIEYQRHWTDLFDLVQEGNLGLIQAVKKFDPYRGIRFSTYASFWIRAYILKFLMENYRLVKIGKTQAQRRLFFNLRKEKERLEHLGFNPTSALLAENLLTSEQDVNDMHVRLTMPEQSLDTPTTDDGKQTLGQSLPDDGAGVVEEVAGNEFKSLMDKKLKDFRKIMTDEKADKEIYIFDHRLLSEKPQTLKEVGEKFDISRERVRQIETRVLKRLKEYLKRELPDFEDFDFLSS